MHSTRTISWFPSLTLGCWSRGQGVLTVPTLLGQEISLDARRHREHSSKCILENLPGHSPVCRSCHGITTKGLQACCQCAETLACLKTTLLSFPHKTGKLFSFFVGMNPSPPSLSLSHSATVLNAGHVSVMNERPTLSVVKWNK